MPNPAYVKSEPGKWASEGVRVAESEDLSFFEGETLVKIQTILDAMDWPQLIIFKYGESDRVVAPFVVGVSSEGNPLMRGYQLEGNSRSGKGEGWRVFQVGKMEEVENHQDFFNKDDFDFQEEYPWIYKVFKTLQRSMPLGEWVPVSGVREPIEVEVPAEEEELISIWEELLSAINKAGDIPEKDQVTLEWLQKYGSKTTTTLGGPSTDIEHEVYSVVLDGITLYYDDLNDAVVTMTREIISGAPLPKTLRDSIVGIQIVPEDARGGPDVIAMSNDGVVTIFGDRQVDVGVIAHETAHDLAVNKWGNPVPTEDSDYAKAIKSGETPVSEYSKRNWSEDFAEAVRMFVVEPSELKKVAPLRYQVINRLMEEKGYGG